MHSEETDLTTFDFEPITQKEQENRTRLSSENFINDEYSVVKRDKGKYKGGSGEEVVIETSIKGFIYSCEVLKDEVMIDGEEVNCSNLQSEENQDTLFRDKYLEAHNYLKEKYLESSDFVPSKNFVNSKKSSYEESDYLFSKQDARTYQEENGEVEVEPLADEEMNNEVNDNALQLKENQDVEENNQLEQEFKDKEDFDKNIQLEEYQNDNKNYCKVTSYQSKEVVKTVIEVSGTSFEEIHITFNDGVKKENDDKKYYNIKIK